MHDPDETDRRAHRYGPKVLLRRDFLKTATAGVAGAAAMSEAASAQTSGPYTERVAIGAFPPAALEVDDLDQATPPEDPDLQGGQQGSSEAEEIERLSPAVDGQARGGNRSVVLSENNDALTVETDFDGFGTLDVVRAVDFNDDGVIQPGEIFFAIPGDPVIAASEDHLVTAINNEIGIIEKGTVPDGADRTDPNAANDYVQQYRAEDWFENVIDPFLAQGLQGQFENFLTTDPRVRYDPIEGRFYIAWVLFNLPDTAPDGPNDDPVPVEDPNDNKGAYLLSVSATADPTGTWYNYRIEPENNDGLVDYPGFGYDGNALVLTQNRFFGGFQEATLDAVDKSAALAGEPVTAWEFRGLQSPAGGLAFTVQPADMPGSTGTFYATSSLFFQGQTITVWSLDGLSGAFDGGSPPTLSNDAVRVPPYTLPPGGANQPGSEDKIDMGDNRILDTTYDASDGTLFASHTVNDGSVRWYEIDPSGPSLVQSQTFKRRGVRTFYPAIGTNGDSMVIAYNACGPSAAKGDYARMEVAGRRDGYRLGDLEDYAVIKEGEETFDYVNPGEGDTGVQVMRWGDYNAVSVDPQDDSYWVIAQYANAIPGRPNETEIYGTRIANVSFD